MSFTDYSRLNSGDFLSIKPAVLHINPFECEAVVDSVISHKIFLQCDLFVSTFVIHFPDSPCVNNLVFVFVFKFVGFCAAYCNLLAF